MNKQIRSKRLTKDFNKYYPGGHTNFRVSLEATKHRLFIEKAKGSHLWDVDGNEYIEFNGALGPTILGHCNKEWVSALKDLLDNTGTVIGSSTLFTTDDIKVAEKLSKHIPCAEQIKFCVTGSEAVQMAIRLARAYTGKNRILRFSDHYHGWLDNTIGGECKYKYNEKPFPYYAETDEFTYTLGRSPWAAEESFLLPWNDFDALENTVKKYSHEIAIIHFEGILCNHFCMPPKPGFLKLIRNLCTKHNIVMSMDEVITGFRIGLCGAQGYLGVTPDIATFGKCLAGGLPFSAVVGRKEIMEQLLTNRVLGPGTFNGYPLGMRATLATLKILEKNNGAAYNKIEKIQGQLTGGLLEIAKRKGVALKIQGAPGVFFSMFGIESDGPIYSDYDEKMKYLDKHMAAKFFSEMQQNGVMFLSRGRWYMNIAHSASDVEFVLAAAEKVLSKI